MNYRKRMHMSAIALVLTSSLLCLAKTTFYEEPIDSKDTYCAVWTTERVYDGDLPDTRQTPEMKDAAGKAARWYFPSMPQPYSSTKIYLNVAIVSRDGSFSKLFSFPAALLVMPGDLSEGDISYIGFAPRNSGDQYREFIAVEGNKLFKYEVGTELNVMSGKHYLKLSTNFAKRRHIASNIDVEYKPWIDDSGNIYYMAFDEKNKDRSAFYKWDGRTEQAEKQRKSLDSKANQSMRGEVSESEYEVTLQLGEKTFNIPLEFEIIDPLEPLEKLLLDPFKDYGTDDDPFTLKDYKKLEKTFDIEIGKVIALSKLINSGDIIATEVSDDQLDIAKKHIQQMADAYRAKKQVLRELKLLMREEGGVMQRLKSAALSKTYIDSVIAALDVKGGGGGVTGEFKKKGISITDGKVSLPLIDYRELKRLIKRGMAARLRKDYAQEDELALKQSVLKFVSLMMTTANFKKTLENFMQVRDQRDWPEWFKDNRKVMVEVMFDYLSAMTDESAKKELAEFVKSQIKIRNLLKIIDLYKKSELCSGLVMEE